MGQLVSFHLHWTCRLLQQKLFFVLFVKHGRSPKATKCARTRRLCRNLIGMSVFFFVFSFFFFSSCGKNVIRGKRNFPAWRVIDIIMPTIASEPYARHFLVLDPFLCDPLYSRCISAKSSGVFLDVCRLSAQLFTGLAEILRGSRPCCCRPTFLHRRVNASRCKKENESSN